MIGYLQGEILEHSDGKMLIGVGDKRTIGSVGYSVSVPQSSDYGKFLVGQLIELYVHTHVREDAFDLYGFSSKLEKTLFLTLLSVNGIGPKGALSILSAADSGQLIDAIIHGDQEFLIRIPGIGKKTAERVVVELRDSMKKKVDSGTFAKAPRIQTSSYAVEIRTGDEGDAGILRDAKEALLGLGYRDHEIHQLLNRVMNGGDFRPKRAEDLVRTVLRQLA